MTAMMRRLSGLFEKAGKLESTIAAKVEGAAGQFTGSPSARQPLEVAHAIVEAVAGEIQPAGGGQNAFPFNNIRVALLAPDGRAKARLQTVFEGPRSLPQRIDERLRAAGCAIPGLDVRVAFVTKSRPDWTQPEFHVEYTRTDRVETPPAAADTRLELVVLAGTAGRPSFHFSGASVAIGRGAEVRDTRGRLVRVNHVAFAEDGDEINLTVSRLHARIEYDATLELYRVYDDGSAQGTSVIRKGRGYVVSRGTRGMNLASGDELVVGRARLKVKIA